MLDTKTLSRSSLLAAIVLLAACAEPPSTTGEADPHASQAEDHGPAHWGYGEDDGPEVWADLSDDYSLCGEGREQSPIDLGEAVTGEAIPLELDYRAASFQVKHQEHVLDVLDNGHTIQVDYAAGSTMRLGETSYELLQFHFHAPSEHTIGGEHFPMEMHLVHQSSEGQLAVLGVLIAEGAENLAFGRIWDNLPSSAGDSVHLEGVSESVDDLLPKVRDRYRYSGSLTTPPCSEGVTWFVGLQPIELSAGQIAAFTDIFSGNNRPVQQLNDRSVTRIDG